ncbi:hypothetical protein M430DRAFT_271769 [Amorphotheca resinae ATCC 22711]|uniref:Piwi domain-containing protein n=1 Tax=Amorphotheca resinae ATCC 22711 TaxID=857342 RepID=A0A2T3APN7_AMORE|nr:hypothetical protein M430DRAFT_271769 [Amorphotheca resinae ATCC 22711]PSS06975.1 hypothetical protein M430DRAFT_271769 [Amorphotheca resinae ATCC 22711]
MEPLSFRRDTDVEKYQFASELPYRPGTNTTGKAVQIRVNQLKVTQWPTKDVYQFDILIGTGAEKRGKVYKVWHSKTLQDKLRSLTNGMPWLWDGNRIAWTSFKVSEQRCTVDLDAEQGRRPRPTGPDVVLCIIRPTKTLRMACIGAYLSKQMAFDNTILECINFLDHAMRMMPSETYTSLKRSFFSRGPGRHPLDKCIEAMRGVYSSIRLCSPKPSIGGPATGLALNVDVANGTFWTAQDLHQAARNFCNQRNRNLEYRIFQNLLLPVSDGKGGIAMSEDFKNLRKMAKLRFWVKHRGKTDDKKEYIIKKFTFENHPKFAKEGAHSKNYTFKKKDMSTNPPTETEITIYDYFWTKYGIRLEYPYLPLVQTTRDGVFPMEVCVLLPNQKYQFKLSSEQTAAMIKFAVTRPRERIEAIKHGVGMLKWHDDPYLRHYGVKIDPNMTTTQARLLPPPEVQYNGSKATPHYSGRWDLRGKKFLLVNTEPLKSWGVCVIAEAVNEPTMRNFLRVFVQTYMNHGGRVENRNPTIYIARKGEDLAFSVAAARNMAGNQANCLPQILLFVLPGRDSFMYERLKRNMECRFAMVSQMLNVAHVQKATPQYCSNVCMKFNAKLGGADVSHPTPGSPQPSMAALTMSFDKDACRYAAAVQTNGYRVEMITPQNIKTMMLPLFQQWISKVGGGQGPQHIYYFRDGVSEGQYTHVLNQEVKDMKAALAEKFGPRASTIKWTVTICTKRHHIRLFPKENDSVAADRNNNPLPGTLVENDVTHPFEYDFYLSSHSAIQGTARPVHYHVIKDEAEVPVNDFQRLIYNMCYQYMRSTTPVSLFPAVYYAHLASNRARSHENHPASDGPRGGQKFEEMRQDQAQAMRAAASGLGPTSHSGSRPPPPPTEAIPLVPLGNDQMNGNMIVVLRTGMWYI